MQTQAQSHTSLFQSLIFGYLANEDRKQIDLGMSAYKSNYILTPLLNSQREREIIVTSESGFSRLDGSTALL